MSEIDRLIAESRAFRASLHPQDRKPVTVAEPLIPTAPGFWQDLAEKRAEYLKNAPPENPHRGHRRSLVFAYDNCEAICFRQMVKRGLASRSVYRRDATRQWLAARNIEVPA